MARNETAAQWAIRTKRVLKFIADLQPVDIEPLSAVVHPHDMAAIRALRDGGFIMKCSDTGKHFVPRYAI